jgi:hypothetical protein
VHRDDFDNHKLWTLLESIDEQIKRILDMDQVETLAPLESLRFLMSHVRSFRALGPTSVALFTEEMLDPVANVFSDVSYSLDSYMSRRSTAYLDQAVHQAEQALLEMGPWPRLSSRGKQGQQVASLYEDLLKAQRDSLRTLETAHAKLRAELETIRKDAKDEMKLNLKELELLRREAQESLKAVNAEKSRVDEVIKNGLKQTADLRSANEKSLQELSEALEVSFDARFAPFEETIKGRLEEGDRLLTSLKETETAYNNISTQAASDKLAEHFEHEAKVGRATGIVAYAVGFVFLGLSAIPLLLLLQPVGADAAFEPAWSAIATRLSIGVIGASAATVVIRLGANFIGGAAKSKRMELELRTFGPFLANVEDQTTVDQARLDLIEKSFGQPSADRSDAREEVVPVSALGHLTDLLSKALSR